MKDPRQFQQRKREASAIPIPSPLLSTRPLAPVPPSPSDDLAVNLEQARRFGLSFEYIPIHSPNRHSAAKDDHEGNTTGLPEHLKAGIENLSGLSLDDVQVHYYSSHPAQVQALAYAQGTEIHVGPGQEKHLAHEAWHIVQQKQGRVRPTLQAGDAVINDDEALEREAETMGSQALQMERTHPSMSKQTLQAPLTSNHELAHHHGASLSQQPIQRVVTIDPQINQQTQTDVIDAVLNHAEYAPWISQVRNLQDIELTISEQNANHLGSTAVTEINNQAVTGVAGAAGAWAQIIAQQGTPIKISIKITSGKPKVMMTSLMHEITMHVKPIVESIVTLKGGNVATQQVRNLHAENIIDGEDAQHSTKASWIEYLNKAVAIANDYKKNGEKKKGYHIIIEAVNDAMTHTDPSYATTGLPDMSPLMSLQDKQFVYDYADKLGMQEGQYRQINGF